MEKIITLEKERKERNISSCLSYDNKIKLNLSLTNTKFFEKAVSEISKKVFLKKSVAETDNNLLIPDIISMIESFKIEVEYLTEDDDLIELIGRVHLKYDKKAERGTNTINEFAKELIPIKCTVTDVNNNTFYFYSILRGNIGTTAEKYTFRLKNTTVKIIDFYRTISQLYIFNEASNYYEKNEQICNDTLIQFIDSEHYRIQFIEFVNEILKWKREELLDLRTYYMITKHSMAHIKSFATEVVGAIFKEMAKDNQDIAIQEEQLSEMNNDYAKSFEIKKNINKETVNAMKISLFNEHFKETEFDNETDLVKMNQLEAEFSDTLNYLNPCETITKFMKDVTLRFRYLGHHKASGLYYPSYKTICIDVRDPSSFLHEFMHMIDFHGEITKGYKLSSQYDFRKLTRNYVDNLDDFVNGMPNDSAFKKQYNGKNKFNKNYYCNGAEIFARCGEIYLKRILKIDNSLIGELSENKPEYFINEELENMIKEYYSQIFKIDEIKMEKSAAPKSMSAPIVIQTTTTGTDKLIANKIILKVTSSGQFNFL